MTTATLVAPPAARVTILRHCRCVDCRKLFRDTRGECFCRDFRGGTATVWATGRRYCDPPPEVWHYCAGYDGPQISKDVWVWHYGEESHARTDSGSD